MPEIDSSIPNGAVSVFGSNGSAEEFPVLKAFQQYIDAEQEKARKRMALLCMFFSFILAIVIAVFVLMLRESSQQNQRLNDKILEVVMKDRDRAASAVVVQPPQDNSAVLKLTARLEEMQQKMIESQQAAIASEKARLAAEERAAEAAKPKGPTPEQIEIENLKKLLAEEKAKTTEEAKKAAAEAEKERIRQEQLEAYRRKHYPELYAPARTTTPVQATPKPARKPARPVVEEVDEADDEYEEITNETAISYFDDEDDEEDVEPVKPVKKPARPVQKPVLKPVQKTTPTVSPAAPVQAAAPAPKKNFSIPVEVKGSRNSFRIPND